MATIEVTIADHVFVKDGITPLKRGLHAVQIFDVVSVGDRIVTRWPGNVTITSVTPPRFRNGDSVTIVGTGFSPHAGGNQVRFAGSAGTITAESETSITVTAPFILGFVNDTITGIDVQNLQQDAPTGVGSAYCWVKPPAADIASDFPPGQTPGPHEVPDEDDPSIGDARDYERLMALIEFVTRSNLLAAGDVLSRDSTGLAGVTDGLAGQVLEALASEATGLRWAWALDLCFWYGLAMVANPGAAVRMVAMGDQNATVTGSPANSRQTCPHAGRVDAVWVLVKNAGATDTLDRVRVLRSGTSVHDSGTGLGLANNASYRAELSGITVSEDQYLEIELTKTGTTDPIKFMGGVRVRVGAA